MTHWIAKEPLDAIRKSGEVFPLDVQIGQPYQLSPDEWACSVSLQRLHRELGDIHGGSSLQALCLALGLAGRLLTDFVREGGQLRYRGTDDDFDIAACFAQVGTDRSRG